jgi:hypothetical protein
VVATSGNIISASFLLVRESIAARVHCWIPLARIMSTALDTPSYIGSIVEELQGGLNGVEVVMFQRMDLLDGTIAYYVLEDISAVVD